MMAHSARECKVWRRMRFVRVLLSSPVETLCGLVLIGAGVYVSSIGSSAPVHRNGLLTMGGLLTTFGGVLVSWVASKALAKDQAQAEFGQQLGNLSRNLGQAASQISRAVEQSQDHDVSAETGFALISQANRTIYGQVNEISVIQGAGFDPAYLLETASKLDSLALQLESSGKGGEAVQQVRRQLEQVRTTLSRGPAVRTYSRVQVACPECSSTNGLELGDVPGDTAAGTCSACGSRYNAHRSADGRAFSRSAGPSELPRTTAPASRWAFDCPSCGRRMTARTDQGPKRMLCTDCFAGSQVDPTAQDVQPDGQYSRTVVPVAGSSGTRPVVACPVCGKLRNAILTTDSSFFAVCADDRQALEVSRPAWAAWSAEQESNRRANTSGQPPPSVAHSLDGNNGVASTGLPTLHEPSA
jgi:hypothetical protein